MKKFNMLSLLMSISLLGSFYSPAEGQEESSENNMGIKKVAGTRFSLPEDRPVERKNGLLIPMPIDEYIYTKFDKQEKRIDELELSVSEIKKDLALVKKGLKYSEDAKPLLSVEK